MVVVVIEDGGVDFGNGSGSVGSGSSDDVSGYCIDCVGGVDCDSSDDFDDGL